MHGKIPRYLYKELTRMLEFMPVVAILGPRQCGKSTLAMMYAEENQNIVRLDLERPADLMKLEDPEAFFKANQDSIICIDEIQRAGDLFPVIRYMVDQNDRPGQFLILDSASKALIKQSFESLAGHPVYGSAWESLCIENIIPFLKPAVKYSFYRTAKGAEIDLILEIGDKRMALEFKASSAPRLERGFWSALNDLKIKNAWVIAPIDKGYTSRGIRYAPLLDFLIDPSNSDFL